MNVRRTARRYNHFVKFINQKTLFTAFLVVLEYSPARRPCAGRGGEDVYSFTNANNGAADVVLRFSQPRPRGQTNFVSG
jgi:hypothetical protein